MLQEESDLSLIIAQIVQKLKGSNLYAQLERQAWVSGAEPGGMEQGPGALGPRLGPRGVALLAPAASRRLNSGSPTGAAPSPSPSGAGAL